MATALLICRFEAAATAEKGAGESTSGPCRLMSWGFWGKVEIWRVGGTSPWQASLNTLSEYLGSTCSLEGHFWTALRKQV